MKRSALSTFALPILLLVGCGSSNPTDDVATGDDQEIIDIINTRVKNQSIGNCWLYASMGWVESLHKRATGTELDLSESWLTYWDWYEKIIAAKNAPLENITTGGFFTTATRLITRYGVVEEGTFIASEATMDRSAAQSKAEAAINASLKTGALKTDRSAATVRAELDKAWGLETTVVSSMTTVFGTGAAKVLTSTSQIPAGFKLFRATDLKVAQKKSGQPQKTVTLADEMLRWRESSAPTTASSRRDYLRRVQKALHDGNPVLVVWNVDWESRDKVAGTFPKMQSAAKIDGVHMTILEDYQASFVPNFGLLPAGVTVSDPKVLEAALSSQVEINFFRIKNSWGQTGDPTGSGTFKGYVDLYGAYLFSNDKATPAGLVSFVLPSDYDASQPTTIAKDLCDSTKVTVDGTFCGSALSGDATDKRLFTCDTAHTAAMRLCATTCTVASGGKDACADPPPPNPCTKATIPGQHCGTALGLPGTDPTSSRLYSCQQDAKGQWVSPSVECAKGCEVVEGTSDRCKP